MQEPTRLSPAQIDDLTMEQLALFYDDDDGEEVTYDQVLAHVEKYRKRNGIGAPPASDEIAIRG